MLWNTIRNLPGITPLDFPGYSTAYLLGIAGGTAWLIAPYRDLTKIATALRDSEDLRDLLTEHRVRLGLRDTDVPPAEVERMPRYGELVVGPNAGMDFTAARVDPLAPPVIPGGPVPKNRKSDREQNVKEFWETQTPQSHHIVEFNNLCALGVSSERGLGEMDYQLLPAVLLAAEFHQRYYSAILKPAQHWPRAQLQTSIAALYQSLYHGRSSVFIPLWDVSRVILNQAGIP